MEGKLSTEVECLFESRFPTLEHTLEKISRGNKKVVALAADISSRIVPRFVANHPDRFFNFGMLVEVKNKLHLFSAIFMAIHRPIPPVAPVIKQLRFFKISYFNILTLQVRLIPRIQSFLLYLIQKVFLPALGSL